MQLGAPDGVTFDTLYAGGDEVFGTTHPTPDATGPIYGFTGTEWEKVGGPGRSFTVDRNGGLAGISPADGSIWIWEGWREGSSPNDWTNLDFQALRIAATGNGMLFAVSAEDQTLWQFQPGLDFQMLGLCYTLYPGDIRFLR